MPSPYPQQRLLAPRAVLLGPGDPNSLENVIPNAYPDGAMCYVVDQNKLYVLQKYSTETASPPDVIPTILGAGVPGRWSNRISSNVRVNGVYFVDLRYAPGIAADRNGSMNAPFLTLQEAFDAAVANGLDDVIVMVAPGRYSGAVLIPMLDHVTVSGWANAAHSFVETTHIDGAIEIVGGVGSSFPCEFTNVFVDSPTITADAANHDLDLYFVNAHCTSSISGANVGVSLIDSDNFGDITGTTSLSIACDGYSWSTIVRLSVALSPANYSREFYDTAADYFVTTLTQDGIAIGTTTLVDVAVPGVRAGEFAIGSAIDAVATDYAFSFHHTTDGHVFFQVTNIGRVSTDFNEAFNVAVLHMNMAQVPAP
jgi:hypothetical protein